MSDPLLLEPVPGDDRGGGEEGVDDGGADEAGGPDPSAHHWWLLLAVALPVFVVVADTVGTLVVLPDIGDDLRASSGALAWVLAAFVLGFTGPYLWFVGVRERGRPKALAVGGSLLFALGSLVAAPAQDIWWLVAARGIQGIGAAAFVAAATPLVRSVFHDDHEEQAMWLLGGAAAVAAVVGPVTAGALADEIGWRMIYLTDLPVIVVGAWLIAVVGPSDPLRTASAPAPAPAPSEGADAQGPTVLLLTGGLVAVEVALLRAGTSVIAAGGAIVALVAGVLLLRAAWRRDGAASAPLMDLAPWRHRPTLGVLLGVGLTGATLGGSLLVTMLLSQNVLGERVIALGLGLAVFGVSAVAAAGLAELLVVQFSVRITLVVGAVVAAASAGILATLGPGSTLSDVALGLGAAGIGHGLVLGAGSLAVARGGVLRGAERHLVVARATGVALGIGVSTLVLKVVENARLHDFFTASGATLTTAERREADALLSSSPYSLAALKRMVPEAVGEVNRVARDATTSGSRAALLVCAVLALCGAAAALAAGREDPRPAG